MPACSGGRQERRDFKVRNHPDTPPRAAHCVNTLSQTRFWGPRSSCSEGISIFAKILMNRVLCAGTSLLTSCLATESSLSFVNQHALPLTTFPCHSHVPLWCSNLSVYRGPGPFDRILMNHDRICMHVSCKQWWLKLRVFITLSGQHRGLYVCVKPDLLWEFGVQPVNFGSFLSSWNIHPPTEGGKKTLRGHVVCYKMQRFRVGVPVVVGGLKLLKPPLSLFSWFPLS